MCKVIAVSCSKGGVGKTTSAVNIGIGLAYSGKKVLLLDVDGQGDLSKSLGVENPPRWAASQVWAMPTIIGLTVWKGMGYYMVVYLAGLQNVPSELYEAAEIDGANDWAKFCNVTWPCLTPTTFFVLMMLVVATFKSYDIMYITTQGGPGEATKVLAYHIFNSAFVSMKFGYASAVAMVLFVIIILLTLFQFRMEKKFTNY